MNDNELRALVTRLRDEADRIEALIAPPQPREVDGFYTSTCPAGWDTVLGYLAKVNPEALELMDSEPEATLRDGWWLSHRMKERGERPVKVPACAALRIQGISQVNAYPVSLLRQRLGS